MPPAVTLKSEQIFCKKVRGTARVFQKATANSSFLKSPTVQRQSSQRTEKNPLNPEQARGGPKEGLPPHEGQGLISFLFKEMPPAVTLKSEQISKKSRKTID
jgi:hypothetical protein